jgi:hypothetical protein
MSFREYSNTILTVSDKECPYPTIRSWDEFAFYNSITADNREIIDAHGISGTARLIYQRTTTAREMFFNGVVRSGRCVYIPDRTNSVGTPPNYSDSVYTSHLVEIDIETGDTSSLTIGVGAAGRYQLGQSMQLAVIDTHKILVYDYWLEGTSDTIIRIADFSTGAVDTAMVIDRVNGDFRITPERITTTKDANGDVHLFVLCQFYDNSIGWTDDWWDRLPGYSGVVIYHKNYTQDTAWDEFIVPFDNQEANVFGWNGRFYEVINNRYLVLNCYRVGPWSEPEGEGIQPDYMVEVVYDTLNAATAPVCYELATGGDGSWEVASLYSSEPDPTDGKLYASIGNNGSNKTISFDPVTGAFAYTGYTADSEDCYIYHLVGKEHAYFIDTDGNYNVGAGSHDIYEASSMTKLGNYDLVLANLDHVISDWGAVSSLLDENGGSNPLLWFWDCFVDKLRALDIVTGTLVYDAVPTGFSKLYETNLVHLGNCLLLVTKDNYPSNDSIDFYVVT